MFAGTGNLYMHVLWLSIVLVALMQGVTPPPEWPSVPPVTYSDLAYPADALSQGQAGIVVLRLSTDDSGRVQNTEVLTGPPVLVRAAIENMSSWRLSPNLRDGAMVFRFDIDPARCQDDTRGLFRLVRPNFATVTACSAPGRPVAKWPYDGFEFISFGSSRYSAGPRAMNLPSVVVLELVADDQGRIQPRPLTDLMWFTEAAVAHARQWRVRPSTTKRQIFVYQFALDNYDCTSEYNSVFWTVIPGYVRLSGCQPWVK